MSAKRAAFILALAYLFYAGIVFVTAPMVGRHAPGQPIFDLRPFGYSQAEAESLLAALGPAGRHAYATRQLPLDIFYPVLAALGFFLLFRAWLPAGSRRWPWLALPLLAGAFDLLENLAVLAMLRSFPELPPLLVRTASVVTMIKSVSYAACYISFFVLAWRQLKKSKPDNH